MSKLKEFNDWWLQRAGRGITMRSSEVGVVQEILDKARSLLAEEQEANETYNSPAYLDMKRAEEESR